MSKKIAIIGAGVAGLSAGCYARMNGFEAEIYESHTQAGGLCTAWKRGEYTFDGCLHWLTGSGPNSVFYKFWNEVGALKNRKMLDPDCFYRYRFPDGQVVSLFADIDKLEKHWNQISPEDAPVTAQMCAMVRKFGKMKLSIDKPFEMFNFLDIVKVIFSMMPFGKIFKAATTMSIADFASRFKSSALQEALRNIIFAPDATLMGALMTLETLNAQAAGFPEGGSLEFAKAIEKRFLDLGGKIHFKSRVTRVSEQDGIATGIVLSDGQTVAADYVIAACDLYKTVNELLDRNHVDPLHDGLFREVGTYRSCVQVSLGLNRTFGADENCIGLHLPVTLPFSLGSQKMEWMTLRQYGEDKTMAPSGKTSAIVMLMSDDFAHWENLYKDREGYKAEKRRILKSVLDNLEVYYPGISAQVEVSDVSTPMTYYRYTGSWHGKFMTWIETVASLEKLRGIKKTVPGLDRFYMAGMWMMPPGGVPSALLTGRHTVQLICSKEKKKFTVTEDK